MPQFMLDLIERSVRTFIQGFVASGIFAGGGAFSVQNLKVGLGAGLAAVLMGFATKPVGGSKATPSILPAAIGGAAGGAAGAAIGGTVGATVGETVGSVTGAVGDFAQDLGKTIGLKDEGEYK